MESKNDIIKEHTNKRFIGDFWNILVIANTIAYIGAIVGHASGFDIIEFSPTLARDGFCVSNENKSLPWQTHAICFYLGTIFSLLTWVLVKMESDVLPDRDVIMMPRYAFITFVHGLAHLSLIYRDYKRNLGVQKDINEDNISPLRSIILLIFWSTFMWVIHPDYSFGKKSLRAVFWTTVYLPIPRLYSVPFANSVLIMEFCIKEIQAKKVDPYYNIRIPLFYIPTSILAWMEVLACETFLQPYGGHAIYDAFIPITQIAYIFILCYYCKKTKKID